MLGKCWPLYVLKVICVISSIGLEMHSEFERGPALEICYSCIYISFDRSGL